MMLRKLAPLGILFALLFSACMSEDNTIGLHPPSPMLVYIDDQMDDQLAYEEVDQETIQRLNLAVESCEGLKAVGTFAEAGQKVHRYVFEKKDQPAPVETLVTLPDTAYAHPDPRYPNLIVALLDGKPAIFAFNSFTGGHYFPESGDRIAPNNLIAIYGLTTPDTIREIRVSSQEKDQKTVLNATITDQTEIQRFLDAIHDWDDWGQHAGTFDDPDDYYPVYYIEVDLENGFSFKMSFWPPNCIDWAMFSFSSSESLTAWIESHVQSTS